MAMYASFEFDLSKLPLNSDLPAGPLLHKDCPRRSNPLAQLCWKCRRTGDVFRSCNFFVIFIQIFYPGGTAHRFYSDLHHRNLSSLNSPVQQPMAQITSKLQTFLLSQTPHDYFLTLTFKIQAKRNKTFKQLCSPQFSSVIFKDVKIKFFSHCTPFI